MLKKSVLAVLALLCWAVTADASLFTKANYLINNPAAHSLKKSEINVVVGGSFMSDESIHTNAAAYYNPTDKVQLGISMTQDANLSPSLHANFISMDMPFYVLNVGGGVLSITDDSDAELNRVATYISSKVSMFERLDLHFGVAQRFSGLQGSDFYYGVAYKIWKLQPTIEYDGTAINAMLALDISNNSKLLAAVKEFSSEDNREIALALHTKVALFRQINTKIDDLENDIATVGEKNIDSKQAYRHLYRNMEKYEHSAKAESKQQSLLKRRAANHIKRREFAQAISTLKESLRFHPDDLHTRLILANVYYVSGDEASFKQQIRTLLEKDALYSGVWELSDDAFAAAEDIIIELSGRDSYRLKQVTRYSDDYVQELKVRARNYLSYADYEKASEYILKAMRLDPFDSELYISLAEIYVEREQYIAAIQVVNEALIIFEKDAELSLELGDILAKYDDLQYKYEETQEKETQEKEAQEKEARLNEAE